MDAVKPGKPLTGRKVLLITVSAFSVIIAVNVYMAFEAVRTFPGLEVENSYVESQTFDAERSAQQALGWSVHHEYDRQTGILTLVIRDREGLPAPAQDLAVIVGRRTHNRDDRPVPLTFAGGIYTAELDLEPGAWLLHLTAHAPDGTDFRQRYDLMVRE